ncbi:uncharacterized protein LOC114478448 [Gouania willdenowi]|uniref:uncharacterized protein LOC114478448 n=1 Tax=Gouania willdenowi TaxID=441366 RepID=UPI001054CFDE|nr:uncharacterized protein LOC114478448 [Gouania willdenowi]
MAQRQQREWKGRQSSPFEFQGGEIAHLKQKVQQLEHDLKQSELKCKDLVKMEKISSSIIKQQKEELTQLRCGLQKPVRDLKKQNVKCDQDFQAEKKQWEAEKKEMKEHIELLTTWNHNQLMGFSAQSARFMNDILIRDQELEIRAGIVVQCQKSISYLETLLNTDILESRMVQHEQIISILRNTVGTTKRVNEVHKAQSAEERNNHQAQIRQQEAKKEELLKQVQEPKLVRYHDENQAEEEWPQLQTSIMIAGLHQTQEDLENMLDDGEPETIQQQDCGSSCAEEKAERTSTLKAALNQPQEVLESLQENQKKPNRRTARKRRNKMV